jgi:hypothetical protein
MTLTAQGYFAALTYRFYSSTLATPEARAEKDALIGELNKQKRFPMRRVDAQKPPTLPNRDFLPR